jgi:3-carboxy-cis,cis-muconate cycloisomerase
MLAAMVQEHERGLGGWHAEWETLPEICMLTAGALAHSIQILDGLQIHQAALTGNLNAAHGLMMAECVAMVLAKKIGRAAAHELVERASHQAIDTGKSFREVLLGDAEISKNFSAADIDRSLDPKQYTGAAREMIDRVLAASNKTSS